MLEDDGLFILASYFNGIAHPPGYPLYTLLGKLFTFFPYGSIAFRVHLLSAFLASCACIFFWLSCIKIFNQKIIATVVVFVFSFSEVYWSQAIIAEVYTLNILIFSILLYLCFSIIEGQSLSRAKTCFIAFVYGLGLSNHWPLLMLSSPVFVFLLSQKWRQIAKYIPIAFLCLTLGLLPYLWMFVLSLTEPEISFSGQITSISELWSYISRETYRNIDSAVSSDIYDRLKFCWFVLTELSQQFGSFGIYFVVFGFIAQWYCLPKRICIGLLSTFIFNTFLLIFLLNNEYSYFGESIFRVYPLVAYLVAAIWLGVGVKVVLQILTLIFVGNPDINIKTISLMLCFLLIVTTLLSNIKYNYRATDNWAEYYASAVLNSLEKDSFLFTSDDFNVGPIGYVHKIKNIRSDIELYNIQGLVFSNRLFHKDKMTENEWRKFLYAFISNADHHVYFVDEFEYRKSFSFNGLVYQASSQTSYDRSIFKYNSLVDDYLISVISNGPPNHRWEKMHYHKLIANYCYLITGLMLYGESPQYESIEGLAENECHTYLGKISIINLLLHDEQPNFSLIDDLLVSTEMLIGEANTKSEAALFYHLQGESSYANNQSERALDFYHESMKVWRHLDNPSAKKIALLKKE